MSDAASPDPPAPNPHMTLVSASVGAQIVVAAIELGLIDLLSAGPRSAEHLAADTGSYPPALSRLLRGLSAVNVVCATPDDNFELTPVSNTLRRDAPGFVRSALRFTAAGSTWRSLGDLAESVRTGQPAIERIYGKSVFEVWQEDPIELERQEAFFRDRTTTFASAIVAAYDFARFRCVVDVGGSIGALLARILHAHPALRGVLFDLPHIVRRAEPLLAEAGVLDRCSIEGGDFCQSVPTGGDAYLLQTVVHDWGDAEAIGLLRSCRAAIQPTGVLLLIESVMPNRMDTGPAAMLSAIGDMTMLALTRGGCERTADEYEALLQAGGFHLARIIPTIISAEHSRVSSVVNFLRLLDSRPVMLRGSRCWDCARSEDSAHAVSFRQEHGEGTR